MSELPKSFDPGQHEESIRRLWKDSGFFNPDNLPLPPEAPSYTIVLPPPNVTDRLHMGHASVLALEDLMIRFHRMNGFRTLWLPGTDHAAIATQTVVERALYKTEQKTRHDLGRQEFLKRVWSFATETQSTILSQIENFGASLDWSRLRFTLDEARQKAVRQMFVDMYEAGVIYRGERIVNWCPRCQSTLADDEVEHKAEKTILYTFRYDKDFPILISTTRPETKLADTAVAVNPGDERYREHINKTYQADFCGQRLSLKIIGDREVESDFGTGALGVTPAHSMTDWRMAEEYGLKIIKLIDEAGKIREGFGEFSGLTVNEARAAVVEKLKEAGLIEKEEEIEHNIGVCYRCGTPIEPLPSKQWFVGVNEPIKHLGGKSLKQAALEAAEKGEIRFVPERFEKRYMDWMKNLRDWCISRQIWFGHSIPVWYKGDETYVATTPPEGEGWKQDEDTLDTWFSSGMWTFSTLGWPDSVKTTSGKPEKTGDLARFHPTAVLETGYEIITLWVSRMIMMSLFALKEIPFHTVYLHGMILDKDGKKMSKSKGNGIDPVEIGQQYGTDAARLSVLLGNTPGNDARLSEEKIESCRNFVNKLWNVSRYILAQPGEGSDFNSKKLTLSERWILSRLEETSQVVTAGIKAYEFSNAGEQLRRFTLDDLADWYLEASKFDGSSEKEKLLRYILETILKLWHPFMPFITETIWQAWEKKQPLLVAAWPEAHPDSRNTEAERSFETLRELIIGIRNLRSEHRLPPAQKAKAVIYAAKEAGQLSEMSTLIKSLRTGLEEVEISEGGEPIEGVPYARIGSIDVYLIAEIDTAAEEKRLQEELGNIQKAAAALEGRLANEEFTSKAPAQIVEAEKKKLSDYRAAIDKIKQRLNEIAS